MIRYEAALKADQFLLIASGTGADVERARTFLAEHNGQAQIHTR